MGEIEISKYISYLATSRKVASSTQNRVGRFRAHGESQEAGEITNGYVKGSTLDPWLNLVRVKSRPDPFP